MLYAGYLSALIIAVISCTDEYTIVCPHGGERSGSLTVSGQVRAFWCFLNEYDWNNARRELRYTVATGERATVNFIRLSGLTFSVQTDDSSSFETTLDSGAYTIVVECGHAYPDTFFNVCIINDTIMDIRILYDYLCSDSITYQFQYQSIDDTLPEADERQYLVTLNQFLGGMFDPFGASRRVIDIGFFGTYVHYGAPVNPPNKVWQVYEASRKVLTNPAYQLPENLSVEPLTYFCAF
jgi:hypothetical protein